MDFEFIQWVIIPLFILIFQYLQVWPIQSNPILNPWTNIKCRLFPWPVIFSPSGLCWPRVALVFCPSRSWFTGFQPHWTPFRSSATSSSISLWALCTWLFALLEHVVLNLHLSGFSSGFRAQRTIIYAKRLSLSTLPQGAQHFPSQSFSASASVLFPV